MRLPWKQAAAPRPLHLALQGGRAHGAFTWGVLDALLEDGRWQPTVLSGTSAGAMNAVVLAHGHTQGGPEGARAALRRFWLALADSLPFEVLVADAEGDGFRPLPGWQLALWWTQHLTPAQLNPLDRNPLRDILADQIDFERLRSQRALRLFIAATEVQTGRLRLFREHEIALPHLLASACLPQLHHAVTVAGETFWDGGYAANPAVFPLLFEADPADVVLVTLAPSRHTEAPRTAADIRQRTMELAFNATFLREVQWLGRLQNEALQQPWWRRGTLERRLAQTRFHLIEADERLHGLGLHTKVAAHRGLFEHLHALGREHARRWIHLHGARIGRSRTVDLQAHFGP